MGENHTRFPAGFNGSLHLARPERLMPGLALWVLRRVIMLNLGWRDRDDADASIPPVVSSQRMVSTLLLAMHVGQLRPRSRPSLRSCDLTNFLKDTVPSRPRKRQRT